MDDDVTTLGGISPAWLANELDDHGVVRVPGAFSDEWLTAMRASVADYIIANGEGDFYLDEADRDIGSPAHRLVSDPAVRQLLAEAARLRWPTAGSPDDVLRCSMLVRSGFGPKARSHRFHYDPNVLTMVVPVFIPQAAFGTGGELAAVGNKRPFRRFFATNVAETILTQNPVYRRYFARRIHDAPEKYVVPLKPGDAYLFWGYRTFHGNLGCAPGLIRTTLVLKYGQVHSASSWASKAVWRLSRSRRDMQRFELQPSVSAGPQVPA